MKSNKTALAIVSALIGAGMVASVQSIAQHEQHKAGGTGPQSPSMKMHQCMMPTMKMKMSGDVDRDFAMMMGEHHKGAVKMIDIYLKSGKDASLKSMAKNMRSAQSKEIVQLAKHAKMKH